MVGIAPRVSGAYARRVKAGVQIASSILHISTAVLLVTVR